MRNIWPRKGDNLPCPNCSVSYTASTSLLCTRVLFFFIFTNVLIFCPIAGSKCAAKGRKEPAHKYVSVSLEV